MKDLGQYLLNGLPTPSCNAEPIARCSACLAFGAEEPGGSGERGWDAILPIAGCLHPRCQAESLPPPSPQARIPAAPSRAGQRARPLAISSYSSIA